MKNRLCKVDTDIMRDMSFQQTQNICITFVQRRPNVFDVGPTLYKCYTNVLCLLGGHLSPFFSAGKTPHRVVGASLQGRWKSRTVNLIKINEYKAVVHSTFGDTSLLLNSRTLTLPHPEQAVYRTWQPCLTVIVMYLESICDQFLTFLPFFSDWFTSTMRVHNILGRSFFINYFRYCWCFSLTRLE